LTIQQCSDTLPALSGVGCLRLVLRLARTGASAANNAMAKSVTKLWLQAPPEGTQALAETISGRRHLRLQIPVAHMATVSRAASTQPDFDARPLEFPANSARASEFAPLQVQQDRLGATRSTYPGPLILRSAAEPGQSYTPAPITSVR
jgi:hypothetical protein